MYYTVIGRYVTDDLKGIWEEVVWGNPWRNLCATAGFRTKFKARNSWMRRKGQWWLQIGQH